MFGRRTMFAAAAALGTAGGAAAATPVARFEVERSEQEWRRLLTPAQFRVLRQSNTERPYSSPLDTEARAGKFHCAGCELAVYDSTTKFDSGTGWPSFWAPVADAVGTSPDRAFFVLAQTEVHCARCGGHLGHVFDDGPRPTGKRYCMNGVAMTFRPSGGAAS
ncbi:MAG: methionine sulfoxide reductase [Rubritepida sp.]|nr:methionine sulfoxide reductase [Rubritepida sp.]